MSEEDEDTDEPESGMIKKKNTLLEQFIENEGYSSRVLKRSQSALTDNLRQNPSTLVRPEQAQPEGARVAFDTNAMKQVELVERGMNPYTTSFKDLFIQGILVKVDQQAYRRVQDYRRQMTIAKNPLDPKKLEIAKTHFAAACNLQAVTHAKIKNRPKDVVKLCEPKSVI